MKLLTKRHAYTALAAALLLAGAAVWTARTPAVAEPPPAPAAAQVDVAEVVSRPITDWQSYSGRLEAVERVEIRPLVSGTLTRIHFRDGSLVRKGELLFTIDPRPYEAEVAGRKAQLAAAQARQAYTASELARARRLLEGNAIARRDFDEKHNAAAEAAANLQAARAALQAAELDLEHTRIVAPVAGRISRAKVTEGNVVAAGAGSEPLTTLVSVDRMYAAFDVDEQSFLKVVGPATGTAGAAPEVPVLLGLADEEDYPRRGAVSYVDNRLDVSSGTIRVRAVFDNPDGRLLPGLYARVRLAGSAERPGLLIDERAIGTDQDKRFVLVVGEDNRAVYREVRLGANIGPLRVVEQGLEPGERIVVNGLQRVRPGDAVSPQAVSMDAQQPVRTASAGSR